MKKTILYFILIILSISFLYTDIEVIDHTMLEERGWRYYKINDPTPYTGLVIKSVRTRKVWQKEFKDGIKHGIWIEWYDNGKKKKEINFKKAKKHGVQKWWYRDGRRKIEENWKEGKIHGKTYVWTKKGEKKSEANYSEGKVHGLITNWYKDGRKMEL